MHLMQLKNETFHVIQLNQYWFSCITLLTQQLLNVSTICLRKLLDSANATRQIRCQ